MSDHSDSLSAFVTYVQTHLTGDEKGESADFLDHLFRALGHDGIKEAGASRETRVAKKGGGKTFADLLWPERVLIEMKSRGKKLDRAYDQVFDYWTHIVPHRPPFVILCNFDEFWIYDFNQQLFDPVEKITLAELPARAEALAFLLPTPRKPLFNNNRVEVTRKAADDLAALFRSLVNRGEDRNRSQRFILQILVTLVSEDMDLLPRQILARLIGECQEKGESSYDLIGGLFRQMNSQTPARGGRFTDVPYFNGGLFSDIDPIELEPAELELLSNAAQRKWDLVKPEIFGTLFQSSMDSNERHAFGAHFTSEFDIRKVVGPTIVRPWREKMEAAWDKVGKLKEVLRDLRLFRVLDPACGSGNFLYVAYRELKRLEREILVRLSEISKGEPLETAVSIHQFYGIDIQPFAVELAKVTLMLAKEQEVRETAKLHDSEGLLVLENPLPLDNLDKNILCADALFTDWPKADAIIGNPPYLGAKLLKPTYGSDYVKQLRSAFPEVPGMADFCVYWLRKAHDQLAPDGRAGLVGTQNIRSNASRIGGLDYITSTGTITEAVSAQVWSGEAAVHVSIVNWIKGDDAGTKSLIFQRGDSAESPWETFELPQINASLSNELDVTSAVRLLANYEPQRCFSGQFPRNHGFLISPEVASKMILADPRNKDVIHPFFIGSELLTTGIPQRWVIDFQKLDLFDAKSYPIPFDYLREHVLPHVSALAEKEFAKSGKRTGQDQLWLQTWWQHFRCRKDLVDSVNRLTRYIACSDTTKRPIFDFISPGIRPDHKLRVFAFGDDYSFGILQSQAHWLWFIAKCSKLKGDYNYTSSTVFDTFPWPQSPTRPQIEAVAKESVALRQLRRDVMTKMNWSLRDLYRTLEEPGANPLREAQARLDTAVRAAYAMPKDADILAFLLDLNQSCAAKEATGEKITPPGLPLPVEEHDKFVTSDCITIEL
ncbi:MAG: DNA methyltransferase [Verrucomicrobiota bacterium]